MAEAILRRISGGALDVESAGLQPKSEIHPLARQAMKNLFDIDMTGQYPKPLSHFIGRHFDFVITVCDNAAAACPVWPGPTERLDWTVEDPAAVEGDEANRQRAFDAAAQQLLTRLRLWMSLPAVRRVIETH
jgi:protein-tyrosine-phosphatase